MKQKEKKLPGSAPFFETGFIYLGGVMCPGMSSQYSFQIPIGKDRSYSSFLFRTCNQIGRRSGRVCGRLKMVANGRDYLFEMDFREASFVSVFMKDFVNAGLRVKRHAGLAVLNFGAWPLYTGEILSLDLRAEFFQPGRLDVWAKQVFA